MLLAITAITFLATFAAVAAVFYAITPGGAGIAGRLSRFMNPVAPVVETTFAEKQRDRMRDTVASLGKILPGDSGETPAHAIADAARRVSQPRRPSWPCAVSRS